MTVQNSTREFDAKDGGTFTAFVAMPAQLPAPTVIIIQEIFGVNAFLRRKGEELAQAGFIAVVPDLFWRIKPGIDLTDRTQEEWNQAFAYMNAFNIDQGIDDLDAVLAALRFDENGTGQVGCIGYCLGGKLAYLMAARTGIDASVGYYGVGLQDMLAEAGHIRRPLMLHIAKLDKFVPPEAQKQIHDALDGNSLVTLHDYDGVDHAFSRYGGAHYDEAAANLANTRTAAFLKEHLADVAAEEEYVA